MPTMPMRLDPNGQTPAKLTRTGRMFALVLLLHVGLIFLSQALWQHSLPAPLREVVTAALLPIFHDAPAAVPLPRALRLPEPIKTPPAREAAPTVPSQMPAPASQAPSVLPAITAAPPSPAPAAPVPTVASPAAAAPTALAPSVVPIAPSLAVNPKPAPVIVAASARMDSCAKPRYPAASERLQEQGVVSLKFLIGENGQVLSGSVEKSSGYKRLDDAALAALSLCTFKPATVDGKPKQEWSALRYRWELNN